MARPRSDILPRVVAAARKRFLYEGVDGASLRSIARDAGTSIGMVYYYFQTKEELFFAVVEDVYALLLDDLASIVNGGESFAHQLAAISARLGTVTPEELDVVRMVVREMMVSTGRRERLLERFKGGHVGMILGAVDRARGRGEIREDLAPPIVMAAVVGTTVLPQFLRNLVGSQAPFVLSLLPEPEELAEQMVDVLLNGVGRG